MPSLAFRKASICSRFSFSASCTLVVNPQHATRSRLILCWKLPPPSGSSCIGQDSPKHDRGTCATLSVDAISHGSLVVRQSDQNFRSDFPPFLLPVCFQRPINH